MGVLLSFQYISQCIKTSESNIENLSHLRLAFGAFPAIAYIAFINIDKT